MVLLGWLVCFYFFCFCPWSKQGIKQRERKVIQDRSSLYFLFQGLANFLFRLFWKPRKLALLSHEHNYNTTPNIHIIIKSFQVNALLEWILLKFFTVTCITVGSDGFFQYCARIKKQLGYTICCLDCSEKCDNFIDIIEYEISEEGRKIFYFYSCCLKSSWVNLRLVTCDGSDKRQAHGHQVQTHAIYVLSLLGGLWSNHHDIF